MKKITLLLLTVVMLVCSAMGIASFAFADGTTKVQVNAYDMSSTTFNGSPVWQANAEDQFCLLTDSLNLNTGAINEIIIKNGLFLDIFDNIDIRSDLALKQLKRPANTNSA